jgi:hypothetical protein
MRNPHEPTGRHERERTRHATARERLGGERDGEATEAVADAEEGDERRGGHACGALACRLGLEGWAERAHDLECRVWEIGGSGEV